MEQKRRYNILVTGGCGFIGWNFIRRLYENQSKIGFNKIINLDNLSYAAINPRNMPYYDSRYHFIKRDINKIHSLFEMYDINLVVNFAAQTHVDNSIESSKVFVETNTLGAFNLMDEARKYWTKNSIDGLFVQVSCYDEKTRALTKEGLKNYWELKEGDIVFSINPITHLIEEKAIEKIIIQDYEGEMIHFRDKSTDLLVTPNHRMYYIEEDNIIFDEAKNIVNKNNIYFPRGSWKGINSGALNIDGIGEVPTYDLFYICGMFLGDGFTAVQKKKTKSISGLSKLDSNKNRRDPRTGRFTKTDANNRGSQEFVISHGYRIFFDVPENDKGRKKLEQSLTNLGIDWTPHKNKSGEHIYFSSKEWVEFFKQFGHGFKNKKVPKWMLAYDEVFLNALFDGLIDSDGHYMPNGMRVFSTSSEHLRNDICEISIKLGMSPRFYTRNPEHKGIYKGRVIKSTTPAYMVHFRSNNIGLAQKSTNVIPYKGKIWCVKVEDNKNLVVERNGIMHICGNTDEVFGSVEDNNGQPFTETTPYHPNNPYSASKASAELMVKAFVHTYNFPAIITNCSNNYGPGQHKEKLIPKAIECYKHGLDVPIYGDGKQSRDWIYVDDHCDGIIDAITKGNVGESYLFGTNKTVYNIDLVTDILVKCFDFCPSFNGMKYVKDRPGHDRTYQIDYSKAERELGWTPKTGLDKGLEYTVDWYINKSNE